MFRCNRRNEIATNLLFYLFFLYFRSSLKITYAFLMMTTQFEDTNAARLMKRLSDIFAEPENRLLPIEGYDKEPLVSLEEAIKPLIPIVADVERKAFMVKKDRRSPTDDLSSDESASITLYTMEWQPYEKCLYFCLNQSLRDKEREKLKPWFPYLKLFLTALEKLPSTRCTVFRGVKKNLGGDYKINSTLIWWAFSSCTTNVGILQSEKFLGKEGDRTLFAIDCCSGKNISQHSYYRRENEILLPPARQFTVVSCLDQGHGCHLIQLRETKPPVVLMEQVSVEMNVPLSSHDEALTTSSSTLNQTSKLENKIHKYKCSTNVNLTFEDLSDDDMPLVINEILMNHVCTILDLSTNQITSAGVLLLAVALRDNKTLKELSLANNRVCNEGIRFLAESLAYHNSTLTTLGVGSNDITDTGAGYLAQILVVNQTLHILTLQQNQIGNHGMALMMKALARSNRSLRTLNVSSNELITDECVESVITMLNGNQVLRELYLTKCGLSSASVKKMQQATKSKKGFSFHG